MCGIAGIVRDEPGSENQLKATVTAMCEAMNHRGPDDMTVWTDGRVALGMVRLSIVGSAKRGRQPIHSETGSRLIFNGELYDPDRVMSSLGETLQGDESDGAALLKLLERRGVDGLHDVSAMFGLAYHDKARDEVILARDAWGQKPLYVKRIDGAWAFASTIAGLHHAIGSMQIRTEAMHEALIFKSVGGMNSAFEGVQQLPAAGWLRIRRGGASDEGRWFRIPELTSEIRSADEVRETLNRSIHSRCSDRFRSAIFLSGGLDSSIVAAIASRHDGPTPHVLTVGYDVGGWEDEHSLAIRLADEIGLEHRSIILAGADIPDLMRDTAIALEDPNHDPVTVATLALSRAAAESTKVVLTGDGSDEFWGGYSRFDDCPDDLGEYLKRTMVFTPTDLGLDRVPAGYLSGISLPAEGSMSGLDRAMRLEVKNRMRNYHLARVDKLSMDAGLEARSPFLDLAVTSLAESMPAELKRPDGRAKGLLVDAYRDTLPQWLIERKKQPFTVPVQTWITGSMRDFTHDLLESPNAFVRNFADPKQWLDGLQSSSPGLGCAMRVWSLLHLEVWHREFGQRMGSKP